MKIIIDERETALYEKCESIILSQTKVTCIELVKEVLHIGDIIIRTSDDKDVMIIERKTFSDLFASIKDGRYEEQSHRLLNASGFPPHSIFYLLEGLNSQLDSKQKRLLYSTMTSLQYFKGFSIQRTYSISDTAEWLLILVDKIERNFNRGIIPYYLTNPFQRIFHNRIETNELTESTDSTECEESVEINKNTVNMNENYCNYVKKSKKENINPENIGEILLSQIPSISSITAITIMNNFKNFPDLLNKLQKDSALLDNIYYETNGKKRKISKLSVENIKKYLLYQESDI